MNVIENENTEFKREYTSDIKKTVVAFANSKGGTIYIGISDDGEIIGVDDLDQTLQNALNSIRDSIKPDVSIYTSSRVKNITPTIFKTFFIYFYLSLILKFSKLFLL
jgi:ATP-dependent DNA helicase RecG